MQDGGNKCPLSQACSDQDSGASSCQNCKSGEFKLPFGEHKIFRQVKTKHDFEQLTADIY